MIEQFNNQFVTVGKQMADNAFRVQSLALQNFEQIAEMQLRVMEDRVGATFAFLGEMAEVRDFDSMRSVWPKGINLARESGEQLYALSQEALNQTLKTSEAIGQLVKQQVEVANEGMIKAPAERMKAAAERVSRGAEQTERTASKTAHEQTKGEHGKAEHGKTAHK